MNKILNKKVSLILLIIWLIVIFVFSSMSGDSSAALSKSILSGITNNSIKNITTYNNIHFIFRKIAHLLEYFVLSALTYNYFRFHINDKKKLYVSTFVFCIVCSILDETHQMFTFERSARLYDVLIDGSAIIIFLIVIMFINNATKRKSN